MAGFKSMQRNETAWGWKASCLLPQQPGPVLMKMLGFVEKGLEDNTPPKFNMEPENEPLEEEIPIRNHHFQVPC